jgi:hypothetical protein
MFDTLKFIAGFTGAVFASLLETDKKKDDDSNDSRDDSGSNFPELDYDSSDYSSSSYGERQTTLNEYGETS